MVDGLEIWLSLMVSEVSYRGRFDTLYDDADYILQVGDVRLSSV